MSISKNDTRSEGKVDAKDGTDRVEDKTSKESVLLRGENGVVLKHDLPLTEAIASRVRNGQLSVVDDEGALKEYTDAVEEVAPEVHPRSPRRTLKEQLPNQDAHVD